MRKVLINYRVKLGKDFVFKNPTFSLLEGKYCADDFDLQIITEDGHIAQDFSNPYLCFANSYEGSLIAEFKGNIKDKNLKYYFLNGVFDAFYKPTIINSSKIFNYALYEAVDNTFYCTRCDLQEFSQEFFLEMEQIWKTFIDYYSLIYGISLTADMESVSLSEDGKVCKIKTRGFYSIDQVLENDSAKLNRILPS